MASLTTDTSIDSLMGRNGLDQFVDASATLMRPNHIHWCDGSEAEYQQLVQEMLADGSFIALNRETYPGSYLHRSNPNDVARTEEVTFICTPTREGAGVTNNWMSAKDAEERVLPIFENSMQGRTMYVIPYLMGTPDSPFAIAGVEVTDSKYVVVSMRTMTRMGTVALNHIRKTGKFVAGLHSTADMNPQRRYVMHFPKEEAIWSVGSGYGGNALLGKKCLALRLGSYMGKEHDWMAEHMLILGIQDPKGQVTYMAAAFPSACGKTNLAMLVPPEEFARQGYKVWTVGDDIAWMRIGSDGRLWAMNPEAGFFGVAPGTAENTNPNMITASHKNTIYTNVALTTDNEPWWEGMTDTPPAGLIDWQGRPYDPANGPAAHPNSRMTAPAGQCPGISTHWEDPQGVPISALIFGGRRAHVMPLVFQSLSWQHGTFVGASVGSETTAAATGKVGVVRHDPMAMLPFCGYNMGDYFGHWLEMGQKIPNPPKIFHVNWFRKDENGTFMWPGFGQNMRVLLWILDRLNGTGAAVETPIGYVPAPGAINTDGLNISPALMTALLHVDMEEWHEEVKGTGEFLAKFGGDLPAGIRAEYDALVKRLG